MLETYKQTVSEVSIEDKKIGSNYRNKESYEQTVS